MEKVTARKRYRNIDSKIRYAFNGIHSAPTHGRGLYLKKKLHLGAVSWKPSGNVILQKKKNAHCKKLRLESSA
ncbi:MAG: hypothetical protein NMK33_01510 [Candidatus Cardinium sp.]|uniref:hypothetical protein n=1 Tax=Cardinium endosymbiont of Dermatophagoides farinae TaxID=2597823 RepID=UPI001CB8B99D|nr:hypothetical protein [Cardinium endosymbiont of Dermatophagoides farinae]UWW97221.1 MAG: hypothetical protein NMK33_01510 [Candidatus Cardinium sp.]